MTNDVMCSDCGGEMEMGFIPDTTYGRVSESMWHRGDAHAKKTFLEAMVTGSGAKYDKKQMHAITAYRCSGCGLLKLYAA